jgi:hypothetical protein
LSKSAWSRFRTERENWVQRVVADGHSICILPERSAAAPGLVTRPIEGLFGVGIGDRDGLGIDHSGRDGQSLCEKQIANALMMTGLGNPAISSDPSECRPGTVFA